MKRSLLLPLLLPLLPDVLVSILLDYLGLSSNEAELASQNVVQYLTTNDGSVIEYEFIFSLCIKPLFQEMHIWTAEWMFDHQDTAQEEFKIIDSFSESPQEPNPDTQVVFIKNVDRGIANWERFFGRLTVLCPQLEILMLSQNYSHPPFLFWTLFDQYLPRLRIFVLFDEQTFVYAQTRPVVLPKSKVLLLVLRTTGDSGTVVQEEGESVCVCLSSSSPRL